MFKFIFLLFFIAPFSVFAQDLKKGQELFETCTPCHGFNGEGNQKLGAPQIAGQEVWYIEAQIKKFQHGIRGGDSRDTEGLKMRPISRSLMTEKELKNVAAYVSQLKPMVPQKTVMGGNAEMGMVTFNTCVACHGSKAEGNMALNAPKLVYLNDWYILAQIKKFQEGIRGAHPQDITGAQMRGIAMTMVDEQTIKDVMSYIESLR